MSRDSPPQTVTLDQDDALGDSAAIHHDPTTTDKDPTAPDLDGRNGRLAAHSQPLRIGKGAVDTDPPALGHETPRCRNEYISLTLDARWCGDITYIPTDEGWLYLATVIDIASRRVVGWATADHMRTDLVADALTTACRQRRPIRPVIFHSDRGSQYTSQQFAALADQFGVRLSVGRTGQRWDNALAESFFATIKRELLDATSWPTRAVARTAIFDFIEGWYNLHRLHSSLGYLSPAGYETTLAA